MKKLLAMLLVLSMPISSFATECNFSVMPIQEGSPAPCRAFLFSPPTELDARVTKQDYKLLKDELVLKDGIITRQAKQINESDAVAQKQAEKADLWRVKAEDSTLKYISVESSRTTRDILMFGGGVVVTVLAILLAAKVNEQVKQ